MRVLQVCPLWFPVARDSHGGIETFLTHLVSALGKLGCEVTVLASGDSQVEAELLPAGPDHVGSLMKAGAAEEYSYYEQHQLEIALRHSSRFDLLHSHVGCGAYVLSAVDGLRGRVLHTVHTPVYRDMEWFAREHPEVWFSTVSHYQAAKLWPRRPARRRVIHNGIDPAGFPSRPGGGGGGLVFIGRMEWVKGPDLAVQVARTLGLSLSLAGPVVERRFFEQNVQPFLDARIRYVGIVDHRQKNELFRQADCVVVPFRREEPFGLVAIEAMACGAPVVALGRGALPEIVEPGVTGYLAGSEQELPDRVGAAITLDRETVRGRAVDRFDIGGVARRYLQLYEEMIDAQRTRAGERGLGSGTRSAARR
jgi:glycosyltransferase involved in cell wall biosynthesis